MIERRSTRPPQGATQGGISGGVSLGGAKPPSHNPPAEKAPAQNPRLAQHPRLANERLILSLLRRNGPLSKIEVARQSGLSAQTAAALMNRLGEDGLIARLDPQRGRVGQPAVPYALAPDGAYSIGLKIGRRSCDLVLADFRGRPRWRAHRTFAWPTPAVILAFVRDALPKALGSLAKRPRARLAGLGIATPFELWNWGDLIGAPKGEIGRAHV